MLRKFSMDKTFIKKLSDILENNLENEQFGVNELAESIGLSRSQLHRKLNALTGKSSSQFIREYRLQRAMIMLQNNVATASEIAYSVGFGSPTYFNTCFSEYYGYPPGEVKYRNSSTEIGNNGIPGTNHVENTNPTKSTSELKSKLAKQRLIIASVLILTLVIGITYLAYNSKAISNTQSQESVVSNDKSIAVLPFKNLSDNVENQYFADGVMDDILNHLSAIQDFKVISSATMER